METYWDAFLKKYEDEIKTVPLRTILEAFYFYCHGNEKSADALLKSL